MSLSLSYYPSPSSSSYSTSLGSNRQFNSPTYLGQYHVQISTLSFDTRQRLKSSNPGNSRLTVCSVRVFPWDDKPHRVLPGGDVSYYDERDVVSFLDPPKELIPLDPSTYNPATYLWKKIDDIPEERRHRLLSLLDPRLITRAWEVAGTRSDDSNMAKKSSSSFFAGEAGKKLLEFWHCRTNGGPLAVAWIDYFKTALFCCKDGQRFGRVIDASVFRGISRSFAPLYFTVREVGEVMSTEEPCDVAYEFGTGLLDLQEYPEGFPKPGKHPWPFNDEVVIYIRNVGPGVMVAQIWQEGEDLKQVPKKLCSEILMVKDYSHLNKTW